MLSDAVVSVDGETITLKSADGNTLEVRAAVNKKHQVEVKREGFKVFGEEVELTTQERKSVVVRLEPIVAKKKRPMPDERDAIKPGKTVELGKAGWVSLFNGKDLTGWQPVNSHAIDWSVSDHILVAKGKGPLGGQYWGYLVTERNDYTNFHLRAEAQLSDPQSSCLRFRLGPGSDVDSVVNAGYSIYLNGTEEVGDNVQHHTGTLLKGSVHTMNAEVLGESQKQSHKPGEWIVLEVIAKENRLQIKIDGRQVIDCMDDVKPFSAGRIGLVCRPVSVVKFRKIELKELEPTKP